MKPRFDVLIVGGGVVGGTLACALGGSDLQVGVIEAQDMTASAPPRGLRVSAITLAAQTVFENIGVWPALHAPAAATAGTPARPVPVEAMRIWEDQGVLGFDSAEIGEPCLAWIIENHDLVMALSARAREFPNITVFNPACLATARVDTDRVQVSLQDGQCLATRVLVGADGAGSRVRQAAGIAWTTHDLGQSAIVAQVGTEHPHAGTAWQHFLDTGPLAFLPLADSNRVSIVWSADTARATELMSLDAENFSAQLQAAFGDALGQVHLAGERLVIPLTLGFAQDYSAERVALIGDAAHTVHPLAGQGVNLGILDAATLAGLLLDARGAQRDPGAQTVLRRYARARKGADLGMQAVTGGLRYLFGSRLPLLQPLRDAGLRVTQHLPPLKNFLMRRASGLTGELPRLAQRGRH